MNPPRLVLLSLLCASILGAVPLCAQTGDRTGDQTGDRTGDQTGAGAGRSSAATRDADRFDELRREFEARLRAVERGQASGAQDPAPGTQAAPQRRGIGQLGQTTIFDNTFNPAISLSADFALAGTDQSDRYDEANRFSLRSMELGVVGRIDPYLSYQTYIHFDETDVEIEEAFGLLDDALPDTFMLKAGRFNLDFGKLSPMHDHDLPFLDKPQVLQEYLGGSLRGTGVELHHWLPVGDSHLLRWMAGITNGLDGDSHATFGPAAGHGHDGEAEEVEPFGDREFENFALHGRLSGLFELGASSTLQVGTSAAWAPEERVFFMDGTEEASANLERLVLGADVTFRTLDTRTGRGATVAAEVLFSKRDTLTNTFSIANAGAVGFYVYAERAFDRNWSTGVSGGRFEHAEDDAARSWDVGVYLTWRVDEFNRLRLEVRHFDDPGPDTWGATLQWTTILGSHGHGIDW